MLCMKPQTGITLKKGIQNPHPVVWFSYALSAVTDRSLGVVDQVFQISQDSIQFSHPIIALLSLFTGLIIVETGGKYKRFLVKSVLNLCKKDTPYNFLPGCLTPFAAGVNIISCKRKERKSSIRPGRQRGNATD